MKKTIIKMKNINLALLLLVLIISKTSMAIIQPENNNWFKSFAESSLVNLRRYKNKLVDYVKNKPPSITSLKNACLPSGKSPKDFKTQLEYLQDFAKGPCNPAILLPGITGSKLRIKINCTKFKKNFPHIFDQCGWKMCNSAYLFKPSKEYTIWIPGIKSSSKGFFLNPNSCLVKLLKLRINIKFDHSSIKNSKVQGKKPWLTDTWSLGFKIIPFGLTSSTRSKKTSQCGFTAMSNMISGVRLSKTQNMWAIRHLLEDMGYVSGLTVQALPYDWRLHNDDDPVTSMIPEVVKSLNYFTNKKVTLIGHSMGNLRILNTVYKMTPGFKEAYIKKFVSIAPPFMGVAKSLFQMICGNSKLLKNLYFGIKWGIDPRGFATLFGNFESIYQLMPNNSLYKNKDKEWVKSILKRIQYENQKFGGKSQNFDDKAYSWFPKADSICYSNKDHTGNQMCRSGLDDLNDWGSVNNEQMKSYNQQTILEKYGFFDKEKIQRGFGRKQDDLSDFPNPLIETVLIYTNTIKTPRKYSISLKDPKKNFLGGNKYCEKDKDYKSYDIGGDGTVDAASSVTPYFKWASEYDEGSIKGSKPVKLAELCSDYQNNSSAIHNKNKTPYDDITERSIKHNSYIGLGKCERNKKTMDYKKLAGHSTMLRNKDLLQFLGENLMGEKEGGLLTQKNIDGIKGTDIEGYIKNCDLLFKTYQQAINN